MVTETRRKGKPLEWGIRDKARVEWVDELVGCLGGDLDPEALEKTKEHCRLLIKLGLGAWTMGALFKVAGGFYDGYLLATKPEKYRVRYDESSVV